MHSNCCVTKWFGSICCSTDFAQSENKVIPEIQVESTELTASYYKEYLGFRIIKKQKKDSKYVVLVEKNLNFVWLTPLKTSNKQPKNQYLFLNTQNIEADYNSLRDKVRLISKISSATSSSRSFTIQDCNGINIVYQQILN